MAETMKRIWDEDRTERVPDERGQSHRFEASITADRGVTEDRDSVLLIIERIQHWEPYAEDPCDGCRLCRPHAVVMADPVGRSHQDSVRIAISHADALFRALDEMAAAARLTLFPPPPEPMPAEAAPAPEAP